MNLLISDLLGKLDDVSAQQFKIIPWACPVICFGDYKNSDLATIGINPSNLEFVDRYGNELENEKRRFHTLNSLGLESWTDASEKEINSIYRSYKNYFKINPYDRWFKKLDYIISSTNNSYYFPYNNACHLDLIPYATSEKWSNLSNDSQQSILHLSGDFLGKLISHSNIKVLVLNGQTVVDNFELITKMKLLKKEKINWSLERKNSNNVMGYAYTGVLDCVNGVHLQNEIKVLGYNHNIQSSFGVSKKVQDSIRNWVKSQYLG